MLSPILSNTTAAQSARTVAPLFAGSAGVRFGNAEKPADGGAPKAASSDAFTPATEVQPAAPVEAPKAATETKKPESNAKSAQAEPGWSVLGMLKGAAMTAVGGVVLPIMMTFVPAAVPLLAGLGLAIGLPILASRVKPQFAEGKLLNPEAVVQASKRELRPILRAFAAPIKMVPDLLVKVLTLPFRLPFVNKLGLPTNKLGIFKKLVQGKKWLAGNVPVLLSNPRFQNMAKAIAPGFWGKVAFAGSCLLTVLVVALESRMPKWLQGFLNLFVAQDMVNNVKSLATVVQKSGKPA